jgi:hypothetical protein
MDQNARARNPLFGPNKFKLGIFSANCDGGLTMSRAPERWKADWDDIAAMTLIADDAGLEFILPVAKWRGPCRHHEAHRDFFHCACANRDPRLRRQGDCDD